jgi:hypothetical protein
VNAWRRTAGRAVGAVVGALVASVVTSAAAASGVAAVYPSGASVPENLLRIELRFAAPLRQPLDMSRVRLLDGEGQVIPEPFLDLPLPSADGRRVSLLLHPGRVKSGVGANLALGRALHAGTRVTLQVDDPAIGPALRKSWRVAPFGARQPTPGAWTVDAPAAGTRQALVVHLHAPISASSEALIAVRRAQGGRLPGRVRLAHGETTWTFKPATPWLPGAHALVTHPDLESPEGHRACAPFEQLAASHVDCEAGVEVDFVIARRRGRSTRSQ